jgi:hypothetical protein
MTPQVMDPWPRGAETRAIDQEDIVNKLAWGALTLAFGALTVAAVLQHGIVGIFALQLANLAGLQVLADLGIALLMVLLWLWRDARAAGRNPVPWVILTVAAGSFGPLLYLLTARRPDERRTR